MAFQPSKVSPATVVSPGVVKPDGSTIQVTSDGTISVVRSLAGAGSGVRPPSQSSSGLGTPQPGKPSPAPGVTIEGLRPPGVKTVGKDYRFKVKRGIDLQGTNVINAVLVPTEPHELASKEYVDRVAAGKGGVLGLTQAAGDALYVPLTGGTVPGAITFEKPVTIADGVGPDNAITFKQLQGRAISVPLLTGLVSLSATEGALVYVVENGQLYFRHGDQFVGVSLYDNPQGFGERPAPGASLPRFPAVDEKATVGTTDFIWNGFAWDRVNPIDWYQVDQIQRQYAELYADWFRGPLNIYNPTGGPTLNLNEFLDPGGWPIGGAVINAPTSSGAGTLLVVREGITGGVGTDVGVQQTFFGWTEGSTPETLAQGDVFTRVGHAGYWTPWKRLNEDWVVDEINARSSVGIRFIGTYDAKLPEITKIVDGVGGPYGLHQGVPDPATVQERDFLYITNNQDAPINDPNLPTLGEDGQPLSLSKGDMLVMIDKQWVKYEPGGGASLPINAVDVTYDNKNTPLTGQTAQAAITELASKMGLLAITGNKDPLAADIDLEIVNDKDGESLHVFLRAESAEGVWNGEVHIGHFFAEIDYSVAWEQLIGGKPPVLTFKPIFNGVNLVLTVSSSIALTSLRGKYAAW